MIGIIGAMSEEVNGIAARLTDSETITIRRVDFLKGRLNGREVVVVKSGVGKVNASMTAALMLAAFPSITAVLSTGVAGGVGSGIRQGDVVIASGCVQHDFTLNDPAVQQGQVAGFDFVEFTSDPYLVEIAEKTLEKMDVTYHKGIIATGDEFIKSRHKADWLRETFNALACDMESCALSQVCYRMGVRFLSIRSVSDSGDDTADIDFNEFLEKAAKLSVASAISFVNAVERT